MLRPPCLGLIACLLLSAGCGSTLYLAMSGTSPRKPVEVFDCARDEVLVLGYKLESADSDEHRITARKYDWETKVADTQFRRIVERLSIEVREGTAGGTRLKIGAHTFAELVTQRGPTEIERSASTGVRAAAQTLLEACGN